MGPFPCILIGEGNLSILCAEHLIERGHRLLGVVTPERRLRDWTAHRRIAYAPRLDELRQLVGGEPFDYLWSIVNGVILSEQDLALPRVMAINYHNSLLPSYAGSHACSWALADRQERHGITWHRATKVVDAGEILKQRVVEVTPRETAFSLEGKCYAAALEAFVELLEELEQGRLNPTSQNLENRLFHPRAQRMIPSTLLCWEQPAPLLDALVRAHDFGPYCNQVDLLKLLTPGGPLVVKRTSTLPTKNGTSPPPGTLLRPLRQGVVIATPDGEFVVEELTTLAGLKVDAKSLELEFGLSPGLVFPEPDKQLIRCLTQAYAGFRHHESWWVERLSKVRPLDLPGRGWSADGLVGAPISLRLGSRYLAAAVLTGLLSRLTGRVSFSVGLCLPDFRRLHQSQTS